MESLTHSDFRLAMCQAVIYTPDEHFSARKVLSSLYPSWAELFDAEPMSVPSSPGMPSEVPRLILHAQSKEWRCELAPARGNVTWNRQTSFDVHVDLGALLKKAQNLLLEYQQVLEVRIRPFGRRGHACRKTRGAGQVPGTTLLQRPLENCPLKPA